MDGETKQKENIRGDGKTKEIYKIGHFCTTYNEHGGGRRVLSKKYINWVGLS